MHFYRIDGFVVLTLTQPQHEKGFLLVNPAFTLSVALQLHLVGIACCSTNSERVKF
jgi:hypothetical protein